MTYTFDAKRGLVVIPVFLAGPRGSETFEFAIDTGSTRSSVSGLILQQLGYSQPPSAGRSTVRTAGGGLTAGSVRVQRLGTFGEYHVDFPVLWLPLAPSARVRGLLGLDFFRGSSLLFDFARGRVSCPAPRPWWQFWR